MKGSWRIDEDHVESSQSVYKDFFFISRTSDMPDFELTYKIKEYDTFLGPNSFHKTEDRSKTPYLLYSSTLDSAENPPRVMDISMEFDLVNAHILAPATQRKFRSQTPQKTFLSLDKGPVREDCQFILQFAIINEKINVNIQDQVDKCIPFTLDAIVNSDMTDQEEFESQIEREAIQRSIGDGSSKSAQ